MTLGNCLKFATGKTDEVKGYGAFQFLNGEDGVWFRRDDDGDGRNSKRTGKAARRPSVRTRAMADAGVASQPLIQTPLGSQPLIQPPLGSQPLMPRSGLGAPRLGSMRGVKLPGPLAQSLSAVEPEPDCNGVEDLTALALVFMLAFIGLKKLRKLQKPPGVLEPLMDVH